MQKQIQTIINLLMLALLQTSGLDLTDRYGRETITEIITLGIVEEVFKVLVELLFIRFV